MNNKRCNSCGRAINKITNTQHEEDYLEIKKEWGYFSKKDLEIHHICVCEKCYDRWVSQFKVPLTKKQTIEIFKFED